MPDSALIRRAGLSDSQRQFSLMISTMCKTDWPVASALKLPSDAGKLRLSSVFANCQVSACARAIDACACFAPSMRTPLDEAAATSGKRWTEIENSLRLLATHAGRHKLRCPSLFTA
ncbi:hypothetical protein BaRGS_00015483 [Batillaria attramentaria]|uniref:Uncharacterized protein n=1 Tax=Batillaria attramentaria TaxID=370345 RepID=A0ABD0L1U3_9CAEN